MTTQSFDYRNKVIYSDEKACKVILSECAHARNTYREFVTHWLPPRVIAYRALIVPCVIDGDAAACALQAELGHAIVAKQREMAPVLEMINTECTSP